MNEYTELVQFRIDKMTKKRFAGVAKVNHMTASDLFRLLMERVIDGTFEVEPADVSLSVSNEIADGETSAYLKENK